MNVQDILDRKRSNAVRTIAPDRTIEEAVAQLVEHNIGSLVVVAGERPVGIVTERDILKCCANGMRESAATYGTTSTRRGGRMARIPVSTPMRDDHPTSVRRISAQ